MTEEEAKGKWCPFARLLAWDSDTIRAGDEPIMVFGSVNREPGPYGKDGNETVRLSAPVRCIAGQCMAWRGTTTLSFQNRAETEFRNWGRRITPEGDDVDGFCGLAGKP